MNANSSPAKKIRSATRQSIIPLKGICVSCVHATGCVHLETVDKPKSFCEQFESDTLSVLKATDLSGMRATPARFEKEIQAIREAKALGLCANCTQMDTCVFPKPEGGIWHCEEYC